MSVPVEQPGGRPCTTGTGIYLSVFELARPRRVEVGRLGCFGLGAGTYLYVGSAQRCLRARLQRHARAEKKRKWHIDHLSTVTLMSGAFVFAGAAKAFECELAQSLTTHFEQPIPGFGSTDCRCRTHLYYRPHCDIVELRHDVEAAVSRQVTWHSRR